MTRPRLIRRLQVAFTMWCGVFIVLLASLWVRSCWWTDSIVMRFHKNLYVQFDSSPGTCWSSLSTRPIPGTPWKVFSASEDDPLVRYARMVIPRCSSLLGEFGQKFDRFGSAFHGSIGVPYWFAISLLAISAIGPYMPRRFVRRTATTDQYGE